MNERSREPGGYPAQEARGAEIILQKRWQHIAFFGAPTAAVLFGLFLSLWEQ
jgi:hypothetical protein